MQIIEEYNRILILGCPGSGKSTFVQQLKPTHHPVFSMDDLYWKENWERPEEIEFTNKLKAITNQQKWIIDGNYKRYLDIRLPRAEVVLFIDRPTILCLSRVLKRAAKRTFISSTSLPQALQNGNKGNNLNFDVGFLRRLINFNRNDKKEILQQVRDANCKLIIL